MDPCCFIFGYGYTANVFAHQLVHLGFKVIGTTRQPSKKKLINNPAITLIDFDSPGISHFLNQSTHILISIPSKEGIGDLVLHHYADLIKYYAPQIHWIGYLSSTGVYGDHQGRWVTEHSMCKPQSSFGSLRLEAEKSWLYVAQEHQLPLHIFRLAGIYGPNRNAIERINVGKKFSIFKPQQVFSRIHVDDIVSVLIASIGCTQPLSIYNLADDEPESSHVVDAYAAFLLQCPPLPLVHIEDAILTPMEQNFYSMNRRVANLKIKKELNIVLHYPSFREGLYQIWSTYFK